jgi:hypothetical protein
LPNTFVTSPTVAINRGISRLAYFAPDVIDTATGVAWDFMTANTKYFYAYEIKYLGQRVLTKAGTGITVTEVIPIFYFRFQ